MIKIVLASRNRGKIREIRRMLADLPLEILSLEDFPDCPEADEPYSTYVENARQKATLVAEFSQHWALADDSGLEVAFLGGRPGVQSARFAGENVNYEDNNSKLLAELINCSAEDRIAEFCCCMVLRHPDGREFSTEGRLAGRITEAPKGEQGFGYDPVFEIPSTGRTLAQLSLEEKNEISHRTLALRHMKDQLRSLL